MSSILTLEAKLERVDPKTPWGFRMQGGKEFGCPLTILKVNDGSLAAKCGLQQGDIILKIGNNETTNQKHKEAQDLIIGSGNKLDLLLQRGGPTPQRTYEKFSAPTINSYQSPVGTSQTGSQNYNTSARPFGSTPGRPSHDVDSVTHHTNNRTFSPSGSTQGRPSHDVDSVTHHTNNMTFSPYLADQNYNTSARPFGSTPGTPSHDVDSVTHHTNNLTFSPSGSTPGRPSHDVDSVTHHTNNMTFSPSSSTPGRPSHDVDSVTHHTNNRTFSPSGSTPGRPSHDVDSVTHHTNNRTFSPSGSTPGRPSHDVDSVTHHTNNLTFSPKPAPVPAPSAPDFYSAAQKYTEREEKPAPAQHQSRSFKYLQDIIDSGQEPPSSLRPGPGQTVKSQQTTQQTTPLTKPANFNSMPRQFSPAQGLYSEENFNSAYKMQSRLGDEEIVGEQKENNEGPMVYHPSETFRLIKEQETPTIKQEEDYKPTHSRTFKILQQKLGAGDQPAPVHQEAHPVAPDSISNSNSSTQTSSAPKPSTWTPPSAPTAKPFTPTVAPPAPAAPGGPKITPPRNPTGVNAVRAKRGEATIFKSGDMAPGGARIPICASCGSPIRGPFVVALGKTWCPDHFVCQNPRCGTKLLDIGFVEEGGFLYCEKDYEQYFAPTCSSCGKAIVGECVNALQKTYHPNCFLCYQCKKPIGGNQFHLEDGHAYCENDWRQMFQTMCKGCDFPIEPGDHWVEAMGNNYHSECFNCSTCGVNLEGQPFYNKGGKPYCKKHTR